MIKSAEKFVALSGVAQKSIQYQLKTRGQTEPQTADCNGNHPRSKEQHIALLHHKVLGTSAQHEVFWGRHPRQPAKTEIRLSIKRMWKIHLQNHFQESKKVKTKE